MSEHRLESHPWVDATPDDGLVGRILRSYFDYTYWTDNTTDNPPTNPVVIAINEAREKRNAIIEAALKRLEAPDAAESASRHGR